MFFFESITDIQKGSRGEKPFRSPFIFDWTKLASANAHLIAFALSTTSFIGQGSERRFGLQP